MRAWYPNLVDEEDEEPFVSSMVRAIVRKQCNVPEDFNPTHLSCFCGERMSLAGADDQKVMKWFEVHDEHYKKVTNRWPARKR